MTKAFSYLRISSDMQKSGDGIRRQLEASKKYAEEHGYELVETIEDIGVSAFTGANVADGELGRFLEAIDRGAVLPGSVLLVESLDRLSRDNVLTAFNQFTGILSKGISIVTLIDGQVYTKDSVSQNIGQLFMSLGVMVRANEESATKSKRIKASWEKRRQQADEVKVTSLCPAWLTLSDDRKTFIIDQKKVKVIKDIFDMSIQGMGVYSIVRDLNDKNIPTFRGGPAWYSGYVQKLLTNRAVLGEYQPTEFVEGERAPIGDPIPNYYPAVISEEIFHLANSKMKARKVGAGRKGDSHSNLFSGLVTCGTCGGNVIMKGCMSNGERFRFLRCKNAYAGAGCTCPSWTYDDFEDLFVDFVKRVSFADLAQAAGNISDIKLLRQKRDKLRKDIDKTTQEYTTILNLLATPDNSPRMERAYRERAAIAEAELDAYEEQFARVNAELAEAEARDPGKDQERLLELGKVKAKDKLKSARFGMSSIIKRNISKLIIHNGQQWSADQALPDDLADYLSRRKITSDEQLVKHFSTVFGKRQWVKAHRYMIIQFKSGAERKVHAATGTIDLT